MSQPSDQDFFLLLHDVARLIRVAADKRARVHGMTRAQWTLLLKLARSPGMTQKELADLLEVEPISVARLVDRIERNGLIERRPDASDRRVWRLHLLPAAQPLLADINIQRAELAGMVGAGVPRHVTDVMVAGLLRMKSNLLRNAEGSAAANDPIREIA